MLKLSGHTLGRGMGLLTPVFYLSLIHTNLYSVSADGLLRFIIILEIMLQEIVFFLQGEYMREQVNI